MPSYTRVRKMDKDHNFVQEFASVKDAYLDAKVCYETFRKRLINKEEINGYFYEYVDKELYMQTVTCECCGKDFLCERQRINEHKHLFCSVECFSKFRKSLTEPNCICPVCGSPFHVKPYHLKKYKNHYCSKECHRIAKQEYMKGDKNHQYGLKGSLNDSWKSDERISYYGYRLIRNLEHPFKNCDGFVFEHRLIAERYLLNDYNSVEIEGKKYLKPEYDVHHIDFNKLNNSPDNLVVLTRSEHQKLHQMLKKKKRKEEDKHGQDRKTQTTM